MVNLTCELESAECGVWRNLKLRACRRAIRISIRIIPSSRVFRPTKHTFEQNQLPNFFRVLDNATLVSCIPSAHCLTLLSPANNLAAYAIRMTPNTSGHTSGDTNERRLSRNQPAASHRATILVEGKHIPVAVPIVVSKAPVQHVMQ
jgi:hypothetical protein